MNNPKRKCLKNLSHRFETIEEYDTHIVKKCLRCKVKHWQHRRDDIGRKSMAPKPIPVPTMDQLQYHM